MHNIKCIILTNLIPDRSKQISHDNIIKNWLNQDHSVTVLELLTDNLKGKYLQPENAVKWLINCISENRQSLRIIDASRDHYWREIIENESKHITTIEHLPYINDIFDNTLPGEKLK